MNAPALRYRVSADDKASATFRRIRGEIEGMKASTATLRGIIGPLAPQIAGAFTVAAVGAWINRVNAGVDALNDLADVTGDSVENLSALEDVAARTGTSMDTAASAVIKLNQALIEARRDPDSNAGRALRNLGLDIKDLMALSPVERLQAVGAALNNFGGENKLEYNLTLLGKSARELAPLLKDLAESGKLQATVTTQQAAEAEKLNKEWAALEKSAVDLSRSLVGPLVSSINKTIEVFRQGRQEGKGFFEILRNEQLKLLGLGAEAPGIDDMRKQLAGLDGALANVQLPPQMRVEYQQRRLKLAEQIAEAERKATDAFLRGDKDTGPAQLPSLPGLGDKAGDKSGVAAARKAAEARRKLALEAAQAELELEQMFLKDKSEAWAFYEKSELARSEESIEARKLMMQQWFDFIDQEQDDAIAEGQRFLDALEGKTKEVGETGKKAGEELALVFSSAAGEALTQWQGVGNLLKGILADLAQIAVRETITKPLSSLLTSSLEGFGLASLFGGGRAAGGPVSAGRMYEVNERGPGEMFNVGSRQYLLAGRNGSITPAGGGGGIVVQQTLYFGSGVNRNELAAWSQTTQQQTIAAIADARRRGYAMGAS